ncbi:RNA polymerase factor sigma-54 [Alkalibacterium psychrotolerans]
MNHRQVPHQSQKQKQTYLPNLVQNVQLLQLNRIELSNHLNNLILGNPLIDLPENESRLTQVSAKDSTTVIEETAADKPSLFTYLKEQIELLYRPTYLRELLFWWVNQLDHKGYVTKSVEEAVKETGATKVQLIDALTLLQQLDPPGIGARSLQESLMLQTERLDWSPEMAYLILEEQFEALSQKRWRYLAEFYGIQEETVREIFAFIQKLSPAPAEQFMDRQTPFILPELSVTTENGELTVSETKYKTPLLTFNIDYFNELAEREDPSVTRYIKEKKQEYTVLQNGLKKRRETVLRVGTAIVMHQRQFFEQPENGLVPLQLNDLAQELQLDESTVSRAVRESYIQTKTGTFELKSFLSRRTAGGGSQDQIDRQLLKLIQEEDKNKPYSDQALSDQLKASGIQLSRRGVNKYRQKLSIPSSTERKA